jgi:hypothetical protein
MTWALIPQPGTVPAGVIDSAASAVERVPELVD